ncbi:MAG: MBL fold metallo-hydrolase [Nitriliruptor sp.]|nr:MAG: MBL fold metallo-hydrolase [Nitriliruptor sp.]
MSGRELVVLGTASQVPTRERAHHGALLRFDGHGVLLDPGEGTQRQLSLAQIPASAIDRVCITHAHGDHCLGLPGVLQRMALDGVTKRVTVHHPHHATPYIDALCHASASATSANVRSAPTGPGVVSTDPPLEIHARELSHSIPTLGWRFVQPAGVRLLPEQLDALQIPHEARSELVDRGSIRHAGRTIRLEEVSVTRRPVSIAHIMDTRRCDGANELAADADLLLIEATFLESERDVAEESGHLTAAQAARIAADAGVHRAVLTHLSRRYPGTEGHLAEARRAAPTLDLHVASDLDLIPLSGPVVPAAPG